MNRRANCRTVICRLLTVGLSVLLLSCGGSRHAISPRAEEFTHFVLIIEESSGQVSHSWQHAADFDLSRYAVGASTTQDGRIVFAASRPRDCDQEQIDCYRSCMKSRLPSSLNHIKRSDGGKDRHCSKKCLGEYNLCLKLQEINALEFSTASGAVEWLKRNQTEVLVGSIVIIAGVAFVTLSAGAGLVVLAPLVLVAN